MMIAPSITRGVRLLGKPRPRPATPTLAAAECVRSSLTGGS